LDGARPKHFVGKKKGGPRSGGGWDGLSAVFGLQKEKTKGTPFYGKIEQQVEGKFCGGKFEVLDGSGVFKKKTVYGRGERCGPVMLDGRGGAPILANFWGGGGGEGGRG